MDKELTIEQAHEQIEETLRRLESEALPMEEAMSLYAKAGELLCFCMDTLNNYKGAVSVINEKLAAYEINGENDE